MDKIKNKLMVELFVQNVLTKNSFCETQRFWDLGVLGKSQKRSNDLKTDFLPLGSWHLGILDFFVCWVPEGILGTTWRG